MFAYAGYNQPSLGAPSDTAPPPPDQAIRFPEEPYHGQVYEQEVSWDAGYIVDPHSFRGPWWGVTVEALVLNREGKSNASLSIGTPLPEFGYHTGGRFTLDRHVDEFSGWSLAYIGPYDWNSGFTVAGAALNTPLIADGGASVSAFNNATQHIEAYGSTFHSVELQYKEWAWDVMTFYYGGRFIHVSEDFVFGATGPGGALGLLGVSAENNLAGAQAGLDVHWPLGPFSSTVRLKGGLFGNFVQSDTLLVNNGVVHVNNSVDDVEFAAIIETGYFFSVQLSPNVRVHAGYELWWLYGLAEAPAQLVNPITPATGSTLDANNDVIYHGGSLGVEIAF